MKALTIFTTLLLSIVTLSAENAIILDITEFAHYPEIKSSQSQKVISNIYDKYGSHFPTTILNNSKDGTNYFPSFKNINSVLEKGSKKSLIYISSHVKVYNGLLLIALPESSPAKNQKFISAKNLGHKPAMVLLQVPTEVTTEVKDAFFKSFKDFNGAAILLSNNDNFSYAVDLFQKDLNLWRSELLNHIYKNSANISGRLVNIGADEISRLKNECKKAKVLAEQLGAKEFASELFTAAIIKYRISNSTKLDNITKDYFKWTQTLDAFLKCKSIALKNKYALLTKELNSETLEIFSHPDWDRLQQQTQKADAAYVLKDFGKSSDLYNQSTKLIQKIHADIASNLQDTIDEDPSSPANKGIIKSLIDLKPDMKMRYGYIGLNFTNSKTIKLTYIPSGSFMMGSPKGEDGREWDEDQHQVTITKDFYMSTTEVTEDQFRQVMGMSYKPEQGVHANDSDLTHMAQNPIRVSWQEAVKFCKTLSKLEGKVYRLPTEAEWEYACRANTKQAFNTGNTISISQATTKESNLSSPAKCSSKSANTWGLYDMHGNVWEWCSDWSFMYNAGPASDPQGPTEEFANENELDMKVVRGGSYDDPAIKARSANRWEYSPSVTSKRIGFRIVLELQK